MTDATAFFENKRYTQGEFTCKPELRDFLVPFCREF